MRRDRRPACARAALALGLALGLLSNPAAARHHRDAAGRAGDFDYYLLSLSWSPAYCLDAPGAEECGASRRYGFIVHGLWPQGEHGSPEYCGGRRRVPADVVDGITDLMPARGLVFHEWSAHGSCSGLAPAEFFATVRRAYAAVTIPSEWLHPTGEVERPTEAIARSFLAANRGLPADALIVTCTRQDQPRLREVRLCLDRDLKPRRCSPEVLRGACPAARLIVPPLR